MAAAGAASRRSRIGSHVAPILLLTVVSATLASCGKSDENPYGLADFQGTASGRGSSSAVTPAPSATAASSPSPSGPPVHLPAVPDGAVTYHPSDTFGEGAWVERGTIVASTQARKDVVGAAFAFMSARVQLSNTWQIDEPALKAVATGQALSNMRQRADTQRAAERRSVGRFVLNVASVRISGDTARLFGCSYDGTVEVSTLGSVLSEPPGGVELPMNLQRRGDQWRVTSFPTEKTFCEVPSR
jgi:hypothetical protein